MNNSDQETYNNENLITLDFATKLTGVTKETILKFIEVGCLSDKGSANQSPLIDRIELISVVGASEDFNNTTGSFIPSSDAVSDSIGSDQADSTLEISSIENDDLDDDSTEEITAATKSEISLEPEAIHNAIKGEDAMLAADEKTTVTPTAKNHITSSLQAKNLRSYLQVIKIQDKVLLEKEERIASLEKQVAWLRSRIEGAELSAEREKMLLLTQAKTIQELSTRISNKPSFIKGLLQGVGLLPPPNTNNS